MIAVDRSAPGLPPRHDRCAPRDPADPCAAGHPVNFQQVGLPWLGVLPPVWTLSVEVGFYVVLPFVAALTSATPSWALPTAAGILVASGGRSRTTRRRRLSVRHRPQLRRASAHRHFYASQFPSWVFAIAIGMTAAWAYIQLRDRVAPGWSDRGPACCRSLVPLAALIYLLTGERRSRDPSASRDCSPESRFCSSSRPHWFSASSCSPSR